MLGAIQRYSTLFRIDERELLRIVEEKRKRVNAFALRAQRRQERRQESASDSFPSEGADGTERAADPEEEELRAIARRRRDWVYPTSSDLNEEDEELRMRFPPFEKVVWDSSALMPSLLECEYLQIWLTRPSLFPQLIAQIDAEDLRSPVASQLDLLARDYFERDQEPSFEKIILRYDDGRMKSFLIDLDERASAKDLGRALDDPKSRAAILEDVFRGFRVFRACRDAPRQLSKLREPEASEDDKLQTLLEIRRQQLAKQALRRNAQDRNDHSDQDAPF